MAELSVQPLPEDTPWADIELQTHSLTGWPLRVESDSGGAWALLWATHDSASYEHSPSWETRRVTRAS